MLDEYSGSLHELRLLMAGYLNDALGDEGAPDIETLRVQFVGWFPPRAMGRAEVARHLGVTPQDAEKLVDTQGFPAPLDKLGAGRVWDGAEVRKYAARRNGREEG